jgi:DNA-binding NtrC family response regulator
MHHRMIACVTQASHTSGFMALILCVDDEAAARKILTKTLAAAGHQTLAASSVEEALPLLRQRSDIDVIISDYRMPGLTGLEFLGVLQDEGIDVPLIMSTGYGTIEHAVASVKAGAIDYIAKPVRPRQLELVVDQALEFVRLKRENEQLRQEVQQLRVNRELIGGSAALRHIIQIVEGVAPSRATVLLHGESGTGKELIARAIHDMSDRRGPLITVNCAALPETLVESTLFGHEKGAFTGAIRQVKGAFERAHQGTILLDEISEMRLDLQAKLLRVLQEQEFERVGGTTPIRVDARVVATTNRDLPAEVGDRRFREDLYYRLAVVTIRVPPLRERREDVPNLAHHFARIAAAELGRPVPAITPEGLRLLQDYAWPGNVRELQHLVQRAVILSRDVVLKPAMFDLPHVVPPPTTPSAPPGATGVTLTGFNLDEAERILIGRALEATGQNRTRAAELLGISLRTLRSKLNRPNRLP